MADLLLPPVMDPYRLYATSELGCGMVLHWDARYDARPGSVASDHSYRQDTGDFISAPPKAWWPQINTWAYDFDGSADAIAFPTQNLELPMTCAMLVRLDATGGTLAGERDDTDYRWQFWTNTNELKLRIGNTSDVEANGPSTVNNQWMWAAFSVTSSNLILARRYYDQSVVAGTTTTSTSHSATISGAGDNPIAIMARWQSYPTVSFAQNGKAAMCTIWNRALTIDELEAWFAANRAQFVERRPFVTYSTSTTYTASASPTAGGATASATATFTAPVYTASSTPTTGGATATATATFTVPTYTASATPTIGGATTSVAATFTAPVYTASSTPTTGGATASASATFATDTYTATASPTTGGATSSASATFTAPVYTASATPTTGGVTTSATATFASNTYTATATITTGGATTSATAAVTNPIYAATCAVTVGGAEVAVTATYSDVVVPGIEYGMHDTRLHYALHDTRLHYRDVE